jgi:hypothetical protein
MDLNEWQQTQPMDVVRAVDHQARLYYANMPLDLRRPVSALWELAAIQYDWATLNRR